MTSNESTTKPKCADLIDKKLAGRIDDLRDIVPEITADRITIGHTNDHIIDCHVEMLGESYGYAVAGDYKGGHNVPEFIAREICDQIADMHRERQLTQCKANSGSAGWRGKTKAAPISNGSFRGVALLTASAFT